MIDETVIQRHEAPRTALAAPYGRPFHAALVTIPIGAWIASFVVDIVSVVGGGAGGYRPAAMWLIGAGLVGAVVAAIVGLADLAGLPHGSRVRRLALTHLAINLTVVALFVVSIAIRLAGGYDPANAGAMTVSLAALLLLGVSGFLGAELTYRYGS